MGLVPDNLCWLGMRILFACINMLIVLAILAFAWCSVRIVLGLCFFSVIIRLER